MRLLFDQNLSHKLVGRLGDVFPHAAHIRRFDLDTASDAEIWDFAKVNDYCIVTQDSDFAERSRLYGAPPKVIWLRCGNSTPEEVEAVLRHNEELIAELASNPALHYIEIG